MNFNIISLLPEMFRALTEFGVSGRAYRNNLFQLNLVNPRDFVHDVHKTVDDRPYGAGPGMIMKYQPIKDSLLSIKQHSCAPVIYMSPQGSLLDHNKVMQFSKLNSLIIVCGRYEGIDQRIIDNLIDEEISVGDYVLSGGEIPAMILLDSIIRQLAGALGGTSSASQDSFVNGIFEAPQYTRPKEVDGLKVPKILLSGNHNSIQKWQQKQALSKTRKIRPDLLKNL